MCVPSPENSQCPGKGLTLGHQPHHIYHLIESAKAQETVSRFPSYCCLGPFPIPSREQQDWVHTEEGLQEQDLEMGTHFLGL